MNWPKISYVEEVMREGLGVEDVRISLDAKLELLAALSETGLKNIRVGSFVSPRFIPQMAGFEQLLQRIRPPAGVIYTTFIANAKAREQVLRYSPPLTIEAASCKLFVDLCDIHQRRNLNRSIEQIMVTWPEVIADAKSRHIGVGQIGVGSAWGSNFQGKFSQGYRFSFLERQIELLQNAGIDVVEIGLHDSQSWCLPHEMAADFREIKRRWPHIKRFHLHMHNARGMALPSIYAAMTLLDAADTLEIEGTLGGIGGGQYSGNGRAAGMTPTEDLMHMLEGMGIETGVNLDKLIECVWLLERVIGRPAFGFVSKAGPRPMTADRFFDANLPAVETLTAAKHFKLGREIVDQEGGYSPWKAPITGPFYKPW